MAKSKSLILELVRESKIHELLSECDEDSRLEASGVVSKDGFSYVVFDNIPDIARLDNALSLDADNRLVRQQGEGRDFEDITFDDGLQRFLVVQESHVDERGRHCPRIEEYDLQLNLVSSKPVDFVFKGETNKGIEGLCHVNWGGKSYVLGLSEGNKAKEGKKSEKPGHGRIHVFEEEETQWGHRATLELPKTAYFKDYAGISIDGLRVAVVSQENSALWVGKLKEGGWYFADEGVTYLFPRDGEDKIIYGNVEGVCWLGEHEVVVVSDKRKTRVQPKRCKAKDQSIHVFRLPPERMVL